MTLLTQGIGGESRLAYSPDGTKLAVAANDGVLRVIDAVTPNHEYYAVGTETSPSFFDGPAWRPVAAEAPPCLHGAVAPATNGHPSGAPDHPFTVSKAVSLILSKNDPCNLNYGAACATPSTITVSGSAFGGDANEKAVVLLCNNKVALAPTSNGSGGQGDADNGCDVANGRGLASMGLSASGSLNLDASGNLASPVTLQLPSNKRLRALGGALSTNTHAECPPTPADIAAGWTCSVVLAQFDPAKPVASPNPAAYRQVFLKSPIPSITCNNATCPASIPTGTVVKVTGAQFPCKVITPDDPGTPAYDGACTQAHTNKTILIKRVSTGLLIPGAITPTSQTANVDGSYTDHLHHAVGARTGGDLQDHPPRAGVFVSLRDRRLQRGGEVRPPRVARRNDWTRRRRSDAASMISMERMLGAGRSQLFLPLMTLSALRLTRSNSSLVRLPALRCARERCFALIA